MNVFDEMGSYWAEMADENSTEQQIQFLKSLLPHGGVVLDLACGTGRHSIPLIKEGYDIVGLDISLRLLKIAKNRWTPIQLVRADMRSLPFRDQVFLAAISMDTSFGYLPSEKDDMQCLSQLQRALIQDGIFIVDVFNVENLFRKYRKKLGFKWVFLAILSRFNNQLSKWLLSRFFKWIEYPSFFLLKARTVKTEHGVWTLQDLWATCEKKTRSLKFFKHIARLYEPQQLEAVLEKSGFVVNKVYGDYEAQSFDAKSSRLIVLASLK